MDLLIVEGSTLWSPDSLNPIRTRIGIPLHQTGYAALYLSIDATCNPRIALIPEKETPTALHPGPHLRAFLPGPTRRGRMRFMKRSTLIPFLGLVLFSCVACRRTVAPANETHAEVIDRVAPAQATDVRPLEVIALANEGFLLRSGEQAVLIDAFLSMRYAGCDPLPKSVLDKLIVAEAPFDGIDLALVSHEHADHVQADPARRFLAASPDTLLATSPQVLAIVAGDDGWEAPALEAHLPEAGETSTVQRAGVHVEFLRLPHGSGGFASIQNLGHVITIGGQCVLHLGDAATEPENFRPYALAGRALDVALIPYWYFLERGGRRLVDDHLLARHVIACHIPGNDRDEIARTLATSYPHVIVPAEPLQRWTIEVPGK